MFPLSSGEHEYPAIVMFEPLLTVIGCGYSCDHIASDDAPASSPYPAKMI